MRKFVVPSAWLLLCLLLIVFSNECMSAASDALTVWWERVLPALLPFSVFLSLAQSAGLFSMLEYTCRPITKRLHLPAALPPAALFGMLSGYPNGARLCSLRGIPIEAGFCSFCSPIFLLGVVSQGLYGSVHVFWPLLLAHICSGLLSLGLRCLFKDRNDITAAIPQPTKTATGFITQLRESLLIMASVGGCMVLFSVGIALVKETHLLRPVAMLVSASEGMESVLLANLHGIFEFAGGCVSISELDLPLRWRISMTAGTVSFGGLCVLMQSAMFLDANAVRRYVGVKSFQGVLAFILAYFLCPMFLPNEMAVLVSSDELLGYAANAMSMGSILFASSTVLVSFYLFSLALKRRIYQTA